MGHLIRAYKRVAYGNLLSDLRDAHEHLVTAAVSAMTDLNQANPRWGIQFKRMHVEFGDSRPECITKHRERLVEVVNMAATAERLIDSLSWFSSNLPFSEMSVLHCHPSTSSSDGTNDIVLGFLPSDCRAIIEVTDVASTSASQNNKELKDLANLGCASCIPEDGIRRFLCTSAEFAGALLAPQRKWNRRHYKYRSIAISNSDTVLLEFGPAQVVVKDLPQLDPDDGHSYGS